MAQSKNDVPEINDKSKKSEILEAYNAMLSKMNNTKQMSLPEIKKQEDEKVVVQKTANLSGEKIAKGIMELKLSTIQELDALEQKMSSEHRKFMDLQAAIAIESKNLQDLYEISKNANSLAALLQAQKEHKEQFEHEMAAKHREWERESDEIAQAHKEEQAKIKRNRQREEEEYTYNLQLERKKEVDAYEAHRKALVVELEERETAIQSREAEYATLLERVAGFPAELEKAVKDAEKAAKSQIESFYKHQIDLSDCQVEAERKLQQHTIASLQDKIKEQEAFIKQLAQKADTSNNQVQEIALKAIEGSASRFYAAQPTTNS